MIMAQEMVMRDKHRQTYLLFMGLITELCREAWVLKDAKKDAEVTPTSCADIRLIAVEYLNDEVEMNKAVPLESYPIVDTKILLAEAHFPTSAPRTSGTSSVVPSDTRSS